MKGALPDDIAAAGVNLERYAVLQALTAAAPRIACERIPNTVKHFFAVFCTEIATNEPQWNRHFDMEGEPERFSDMAQLATLRRFLADTLNFAYERLPPLRMMLWIPTRTLPGYIYRRIVTMPFNKPSIGPHINYGRKSSLILRKSDYERGLWLIAKTLEMNSEVSGLNGWSWFHSKVVGEIQPHLAWMRDVMADNGAYLIDTLPAEPGRYGFTYNNRKRQILYDQGKFCPRQTAFFWPRDNVLYWASQHPEFAPEGEPPIQPPKHRADTHLKSPKPARQSKRNSSITLWNGKAALDRMGQYPYIALVLVLPALILSLAMLGIAGPWLALSAFPIWVLLAHAFQYYFSQ
ncbi:MAG: hypothetical protein P8Y47_07650 [Alphaproteobacteria bacterium]